MYCWPLKMQRRGSRVREGQTTVFCQASQMEQKNMGMPTNCSVPQVCLHPVDMALSTQRSHVHVLIYCACDVAAAQDRSSGSALQTCGTRRWQMRGVKASTSTLQVAEGGLMGIVHHTAGPDAYGCTSSACMHPSSIAASDLCPNAFNCSTWLLAYA